MKLAIMQPYFMPYIGYFQLINVVDKFVVYDDVNFINKGWINRNRILVNGQPYLFTVPLKNASQNVLIKDLQLAVDDNWKNKFLKTLEFAYKKAPFFENTFELAKEVINTKSKFLKAWHFKSFGLVRNYLGINTTLIETSTKYNNRNLKGQERILDICLKENADHYINPIGGVELYSKEKILESGVKLNFIKMNEIVYHQGKGDFIPNLSIVDVLMWNPKEDIKSMLYNYTLVEGH